MAKEFKIITHADKCPHLSQHIECNVGGFGNLECFRPEFHEECLHKKRHARKLARRENA